jgi:hypothetical protein
MNLEMIKNRDKLFWDKGIEEHQLAIACELLEKTKDQEY